MTQRRSITIILLLATVCALLAGPVTAQSESDARAEREEIRQQRAQLASELDPLLASDQELEATLSALNENVAEQEARVEDSRRAVEAAEEELASAEARIEELEAYVATLDQQAADLAVEAFISPTTDEVTEVFESSDLNEASRKQAFIDQLNSENLDVLEALRVAEEDLAIARADAEIAATEAEQLRQEEEERLAQLEAARAEQQRVEEALDVRISGLTAEIDALDAEEARVQQIIQAAEQDRAQAAAAAAAAEQPSGDSAGSSGSSGGSSGGGGGGGSVGPSNPGGFAWPASCTVTSGFGMRWGRMHKGIDCSAPSGTPIYASKGGTVIFASSDGSGYGTYVIVDHGGGYTTLYGHMSSLSVRSGQSVSQGTNLGGMGCTGSCTGPHVHFEVRVNGTAQDPMNYL
ncbi:MAG: Murein hydrolase activator EnvC [Acidimicrobiales bacterium]|nr:MAG: hypothetical protein EDR02_04375 [Actinomycetota bacterium]MBV6507511.1 Murein hydrolase activator EnvC [Acidimicrobiales bacterium]RIK07886.1 MAG: hypothetical protein DCC48_02740 [Acidobacteriota bacterium]